MIVFLNAVVALPRENVPLPVTLPTLSALPSQNCVPANIYGDCMIERHTRDMAGMASADYARNLKSFGISAKLKQLPLSFISFPLLCSPIKRNSFHIITLSNATLISLD